jgi:L-threonylcarbamoyladenylate synthase
LAFAEKVKSVCKIVFLNGLAETLLVRTVITEDPAEAASVVRSGGLSAFPTETVYGLGANIFDEAAVAKIFEAKGRPADNPLIAHVGEIAQIEEVADHITADAQLLMEVFFPGPLTIVLKKSWRVPRIATAGLDTIGVRMPLLQLAREFLRACATPVAAPSANISGRPSPTTWQAVAEDLEGRIHCILKGPDTEIGLESTVVDCTTERPIVLRHGAVSIEQLREVCPDITSAEAGSGLERRSPGTRHKHYSPRAKVVLVDRSFETVEAAAGAYIGLDLPKDAYKLVRICPDAEDYARSLYEFFRECDRLRIATIYCETVAADGIGTALMDRLRRAAEA